VPVQAPANTDEFLALLRRSGLLPSPAPDFAGLSPDPTRAAAELVRRKVLTPFQAKMLLAGRSRGFRLGDYVIRDQIGQGGMGSVYLGVHRTLGRRAAIKVLPPSIATDELSRKRFLREARTAAALDHPNVVKLYDVARDEEVWYLVMEFVEGKTLDQLLKADGPLPPAQAAGFIAQAAAGLQHAHEKGFIHRDIKPGNLILTPDGTVKILDMGLARPVGPEGILTVAAAPGAVIGTPDYISPEQVMSDPDIDIRADIYCLGLTFFTLVTGHPPFEGSMAAKMVKQKLAELPPVTAFDPTFPPALARVITKMTQKQPEDRYDTPADVILAIKPWLADSPSLAAGVARTRAASHQLSTQSLRAAERVPKERKPVPIWVWAIAGGVGLALISGGIVVAVALMLKQTP
jgi:serine/threonine protein kinase